MTEGLSAACSNHLMYGCLIIANGKTCYLIKLMNNIYLKRGVQLN